MHVITFFLSLFLLNAQLVGGADYNPAEKIFLNCGGPPESLDAEGRKWILDDGYSFSGGKSMALPVADTGVSEVPYMNARVFNSSFTYTFTVAPGRKFLRLHFYTSGYGGRSASEVHFAVRANSHKLFTNFSIGAVKHHVIVKEYSVFVENETLNVTFIPYFTAYAFINGIEIVSMPDILYTSTSPTQMLDNSAPFMMDNTTALESVYRLNVGGNYISPSRDSGLLRAWNNDTLFLYGAAFGVTELAEVTIEYPPKIPSYVAPHDVYATARTMGPSASVNVNYKLSWIFNIDTGFCYLIRLHFCEGSKSITKVNQRLFDVFLNNETATEGVDVIAWGREFGLENSNGVALHKDYVVFVPRGQGEESRYDLWLSLHPNNVSSKSQYCDAILNGVEVFKINDTGGSLAGSNPVRVSKQEPDDADVHEPTLVKPSSHHGKSSKKGMKIIVAGCVSGGFLLVVGIGVLLFGFVALRRGHDDSRAKSVPSGWIPLSLYRFSHTNAASSLRGSYFGRDQRYSLQQRTMLEPGRITMTDKVLCRRFSFDEIKLATKNFDEDLLLGVGGFGKVYRGEIDGGKTKVAIKRGNPLSQQGVYEFQTEIEMLSKLRHRHLVSLIGYCEENTEMILVYDYMAHGTLREHLYKTEKPPLEWKKRLEICIGAAKGLHYLHTGAKHTIIHRDVKTTNILVDDEWVAKVSDFGLSKMSPTLDHTHVTTVVKGSFGYLDPEYFRRQQLTQKSDVYSFGVVLFEVLCARPALNLALDEEQVSLAEWAPHCYKEGMLHDIVDPHLKGEIVPECFNKFAEIAMKCLEDQGIHRPSMGDVLRDLELALKIQKRELLSAMKCVEDQSIIDSTGNIAGVHSGEEELHNDSKKDLDGALPGFDGNVAKVGRSDLSISIGCRSMASDGIDSNGQTPRTSTAFSQIMNQKGR